MGADASITTNSPKIEGKMASKNDVAPAKSVIAEMIAKLSGMLADGYNFLLFGNDDGILVCSEGTGENKKTIRKIENVLVQFPSTNEGMERAFSKNESVVSYADGSSVTFKGLHAAGAQKYNHALETIRGKAKEVKALADFVLSTQRGVTGYEEE